MAINSKRKGKVGELEFCRKMKEYGYNVRRSAQYCGNAEEGQADVIGLDYIYCEIKRVENLNLYNAMEQSKRDRKQGQFPVVFHRKNNKKWLVSMELDDWIQLYNEYYSSMKLKELENIEFEGER